MLDERVVGNRPFFRILGGLEKPSRGTVRIAGVEPYKQFGQFRGRIGVIFQQDRLLPWRSAQQNVELGLELLGVSASQRQDRARTALQGLGLADALDDYPGELSGGMRQRVGTLFGERPVLKLMYAAVIRASESWRGVKVTEFELGQLKRLQKQQLEAHRQENEPVHQEGSTVDRVECQGNPG